MKLSYRGVNYNSNSVQPEVIETKTVGQYRGAKLRFHALKQPAKSTATPEVKYRGATIH